MRRKGICTCSNVIFCSYPLKVVSATFLLVCLKLSLTESTFETWKNVVSFNSKAFSILKKIKI